MEPASRHPITPDSRYFVVRGRLWPMSNPSLAEHARLMLVSELMTARREVRAAREQAHPQAERAAREDVDVAKRALGERGPVWWEDGDPDYNRHMVHNTPYAGWFAALA